MIVNSIIIFSTFPYYVGWFYELKKIIKILEEHREEFDVVMDVSGLPIENHKFSVFIGHGSPEKTLSSS